MNSCIFVPNYCKNWDQIDHHESAPGNLHHGNPWRQQGDNGDFFDFKEEDVLPKVESSWRLTNEVLEEISLEE